MSRRLTDSRISSFHEEYRGFLTTILFCAALTTAGLAEAATKIYRTVDEHGNVVFTDVPPRSEEEGKAVDLSRGNTFTPPEERDASRSLESWLGRDEEGRDVEPAEHYTALSVASPADDEVLRDNAGNVTVVADIQPGLHPNHVIELYLDGELVQTNPGALFQLSNVDRGTHILELRVVDAIGKTVAASESSTFHLQRRSVILQPATSKNRK